MMMVFTGKKDICNTATGSDMLVLCWLRFNSVAGQDRYYQSVTSHEFGTEQVHLVEAASSTRYDSAWDT
jgi:hypothetical protein